MAYAIPISVYKNRIYSGCANGGISERYDEFLFLCDDGYLPVEGDEPNLVKMEQHVSLNGQRYARLVPVNLKGWKMMGGSYAGCSDERFVAMTEKLTGYRQAVLPVHDRVEG